MDDEDGDDDQKEGFVLTHNEKKDLMTILYLLSLQRKEIYTSEDEFIELYIFLPSHPEVDIYSFVKENTLWKDNARKSGCTVKEFVSVMLEWSKEEVEYEQNCSSLKEDIKDSDQDDHASTSNCDVKPVVILLKLGRLVGRTKNMSDDVNKKREVTSAIGSNYTNTEVVTEEFLLKAIETESNPCNIDSLQIKLHLL